MQRDWLDLVTLCIATLGAVLGVFGTWRNWLTDRVRVRVRVAHAIGLHGDRAITVDVVNLSSFPVTVTHIGFHLSGTDRHVQMLTPILTQGERLPVRLEPRAALTAVQPLATFENEQLALLRNAYVKTACGLELKSPRGILRQMNDAALARLAQPPG